MEEPVTIIDKKVLKVLAVDTRMDIMKELSNGSRTPSDLSKIHVSYRAFSLTPLVSDIVLI
jgi:DNA-binding transcriptional ArsR family regulator